ncbi:MAG: hypothetical protein ACREPD_15780 [Stenotrophomonas sp.]|uniref:hypothetical protein n=1 Tax=Stenotrophomonas sp. TaxID=69392 RepID=UPI003D6CA7CD
MAIQKPIPPKSAASKPDGRRTMSPMTPAQMFGENYEQQIRRIYDMTPEQAEAIIRKSGILTASGRLKRGYR